MVNRDTFSAPRSIVRTATMRDVPAMDDVFGVDQMKSAEDPMLDPAADAARIRAFFVHPDWTRRGLAKQLYDTCAREAVAAGFRRFELMAALPGEPLYRALGFPGVERVALDLRGGVSVPLVRMSRAIGVGIR